MENTSNKIVSVIIVAYGKSDYLWACLDSAVAQTHPNTEIVIIDNSLNQSLGQKIVQKYPNIILYSSPKNLFYCAGLNKGIDLSRGEFVLCLNDDVVLEKNLIEEALKGFSKDMKVGMVSGKILRGDKKTIDSTSLFLTYWRTAKERGYGVTDRGQFEKEGFIFGVNGAVAFYRKAMLDDIKENTDYFDSDFRMFYEDLDVAWRAQRKGWKGYYVSTAIAYHARGSSARLSYGIGKPYARRFLDDELHFDLIKNRYLTIIKNEHPLDFLLHLPGIVFYDLFSWVYILIFRLRLFRIFFSRLHYLKSAFKKRKLLFYRRRI